MHDALESRLIIAGGHLPKLERPTDTHRGIADLLEQRIDG